MTAKKRSSKPRVVGDGDLGVGSQATYGDADGGYRGPSAPSPAEPKPEIEPSMTAAEWRQRVARAEAELLAFAQRSALFGSFDVVERWEREEAVREARAALGAAEERDRPRAAQRKPGPDPNATVSRAQIEAKRAELAAQGKPHGYDSLARALGVHRDTIRRRLKDGATP
jgi:hypothetical protein